MNLKIAQSVRRAFTLAELLIVMAIVGIIAAVTIPLVSANSQKLQSISALQKANNTFANMVNQSQVNTKIESWNFNTDTETFVKEYFLPYVNVAQDCGTTDTGCFADNYTAANTGESLDNNYYKVMLSDGVAMAIKLTPGCTDTNPSECVKIIVDTNGIKKPNRWGKDVFEYQILANLSAVVPFGSFTQYNEDTGKWEAAVDDDVTTKCTSSDERYCALKIINDGWEMNY